LLGFFSLLGATLAMAWLPPVAVYWSPLNLLLKIVVAYLSHKSSKKQMRRNDMIGIGIKPTDTR
jgi:hypothetical protein